MEDLIDPENQLPKSNIPPIKKKHIEVNPLALNKNIKLNNLDLNIIDNNQKFQRKKRNISVSKTTVEKKKINLDSNENNVNDDDNNNELKNSIEHLKNLNLFDFDDKDDEKKQQKSSENENK